MAESFKKTRRRILTGIIWAVLNYSTTYLQPVLHLDRNLVELLIQKSTWVVGIVILGLSATKMMYAYKNNNARATNTGT